MDKPTKGTLYVDCTPTFSSGLNTGIQRVVRKILFYSSRLADQIEFEVRPVVILRGQIYSCEIESMNNLKVSLFIFSNALKVKIEALRAKLRLWPILAPLLGVLVIVDFMLRTVFSYYKQFRLYFKVKRNMRRVYPEEGDCLVFLDSFWGSNSQRAIRGAAAKIHSIVVVYDMIPYAFPDYCEKVMVERFRHAFSEVFTTNASFLTISKCVTYDLEKYDPKFSQRTLTDYFYLGSDFSSDQAIPTTVRPEVASAFERSPPWMMVGTIEPRKNHITVLRAFEKLWAEGSDLRLVIIGRIGWRCDYLMSGILNHPENGRRLFLMADLDDKELAYAYRSAAGLVFASHAEGFGLPLVEAMQRNLKVVCSDIPVFREIGGEYPIYFNQNSADDIAEKIKRSAAESESRPKNMAALISWEQAARGFFSKIHNLNSRFIAQQSLRSSDE